MRDLVEARGDVALHRPLVAVRWDGEGRVTVHAGGSGAPVAPHPLPCHQQERGIADEIEQIVKLLVWIVGCPTVQFGLDLPYPSLRAIQRELPLVGIHRRTPGIPASALRACWSP